ncbi:BMC domain-containing protein [Treponema primitia]|uniref:BMC domain-containing protein n=1 Tax=Treponema primitia TaxID=88058 RepID=UPI0002554F28|nr:BMC domain-containing protein [Treponema primitia]
MAGSIGLLEVRGLSASILVLDTMMKTAQVTLIDIKKDMGGGLVTIVVRGAVDAVNASVEAGCAVSKQISELIAYRVFANPHPETVMYLDGSYRKKHVAMGKESYGIIEVYGFVCAVTAVDAALKAADVRLVGMERTKGNTGIELIVALKIAGLPDAVLCAVQAGLAAAGLVGDIISSKMNARPDEGIYRMITYTNLKSD